MKIKIIFRITHLILICFLAIINYYNFAVIVYTSNRDGKSLNTAEQFLSHFCHRMPSRTIWISEIPMGLCSRCSGIYLSLLSTLFLSFIQQDVFKRKNLKYAIVLLLPLIIDGTLQFIGPYTSSNIIRLTTGLLFGFSLGYLIIYFTTSKNIRSLYENF